MQEQLPSKEAGRTWPSSNCENLVVLVAPRNFSSVESVRLASFYSAKGAQMKLFWILAVDWICICTHNRYNIFEIKRDKTWIEISWIDHLPISSQW
jgi:hypothetical protein